MRTEEEVKARITEVKKKYHDARHHCYAYILGPNKDAWRMNDDGEPSGTAGRPIHGQLLSKDVTDTLIVVVRYFGGVLLGVGGLTTAYKSAAKAALDNNQIIEKFIEEKYIVTFPPTRMNRVMQLLKRDSVKITGQSYDEQSIITFSVQKWDAEALTDALGKVEGATVQWV